MKLFKGTVADWHTRLRLWAAIVMAAYVITHTFNFILGIVSLSAMDAVQVYLRAFWRSTPLAWLVIAAIVIHASLGLWKLYRRNTYRMPRWEMLQIGLGISIPFFLLGHITETRGMHLLYGIDDTYTYAVLQSFPGAAWRYVLMTVVVWAHAQIGAHGVMRMRSWYPRVRPFIIVFFVLMPILGIVGYVMAGFEAEQAARNADWLALQKDRIHWPSPERLDLVRGLTLSYYGAIPVLYTAVISARALRRYRQRDGAKITVTYTNGGAVSVAPLTTILEASRIGSIPHASICGGRGRCSTCRVRIEKGLETLADPGERESKVLRLIEAGKDIRLACQTALTGDVTVTRLLPPEITAAVARKSSKYAMGKDIRLVIMFADLRGFTSLSEGKLPYDVVYMLNRYFSYMGEAIEENGGFIDKFLGDGIMALFGLESDIRTACRQSIVAAKRMSSRLAEINEQLVNELKEPLKLGIGLHTGDVVLGEMGYKLATKLTAIGDAVNTASRLEVLNKKANSQLILSKELAETGQLDTAGLEARKILLRGKEHPLDVFIVRNIAELREPV